MDSIILNPLKPVLPDHKAMLDEAQLDILGQRFRKKSRLSPQAKELFGPALSLAVVGLGFTSSMGRMFAQKHGYTLDSNQLLWLASLISTLLFNLDLGLFATMALSLITGVTVFSCSNPLYFANAELLFSSLREVLL
ncbi:unnamed protein product [Coregonus sp. 'balchen']|nr:unnamed protein product [Coregonus sp. 'balchen']